MSEKWVPHSHDNSCVDRFKKLQALEAVKTDISSVQNIASGSRMKRPREVYKSAIVK